MKTVFFESLRYKFIKKKKFYHGSCPDIHTGDIMVKLAPFLKMYTEYVRNFDHAMTLINSLQTKCPKFANIMAQIHVSLTVWIEKIKKN